MFLVSNGKIIPGDHPHTEVNINQGVASGPWNVIVTDTESQCVTCVTNKIHHSFRRKLSDCI